jgi:hypothetical protein
MICPLKTKRGRAFALQCAAGQPNPEYRAHMLECPDCAEFLSSQQAVSDLLGEWELPLVSPDFDGGVYRRIREAPAESLRERVARWCSICFARPALPLGAASVLILVGFFVSVPWRSTDIRTPVGSQTTISAGTLPAEDAQQVNEAVDDLQLLHQLDVQDEAPHASGAM